MDPTNAKRSDFELKDRNEVEGDNVEYLDRFVHACCGKTAAVCTYAHALDLPIVSPKLLHKLDCTTDLLPKL
jgi:hypothetical protein